MLRCVRILVNVRQQNSVYVCARLHFCAHLRPNVLNIYVTVKNFEQKLERKMKHTFNAQNSIPVVNESFDNETEENKCVPELLHCG